MHSLSFDTRPAGIPVVPAYENEDPKMKRKVQRITSPEKWEIKQVDILIQIH